MQYDPDITIITLGNYLYKNSNNNIVDYYYE